MWLIIMRCVVVKCPVLVDESLLLPIKNLLKSFLLKFWKKKWPNTNFLPNQVFNANETGKNCWLDSKVAKHRLTLLFCANAPSDLKCKSMFVYKVENSHALKKKIKASFQSFGTQIRKHRLLHIWLKIGSTILYLMFQVFWKRTVLSSKFYVSLDNALVSNSVALSEKYPQVGVMFLPPNIRESNVYLHFIATWPRCDHSFQILLHTIKFCTYFTGNGKDWTLRVSHVGKCWLWNAIYLLNNVHGQEWNQTL